MDKKILQSLNNFADSFEHLAQSFLDYLNKEGQIAESINKSFSNIVSTNEQILNKVKGIEESLKNNNKINKKIINNQQKLIKLSDDAKKEKDKKSIFTQLSNQKQFGNLKTGAQSIVLIAGAILAIGLAFKLVGAINIGTVLTLSIALPLMAYTFEKIASIKNLNPTLVKLTTISMVAMALGLTLASFALKAIQPISLAQTLTAIGISAAFGVIAFGIGNITKSLKKASVKDILMLPILLPLIAVGLSASSLFLRGIMPVAPGQLLTAIAISIAFSVIGFGIGNIIRSLKKASVKDILMLPILLPLIAAGIVASSYVFQGFMPVKNLGNIVLFSIGLGIAVLFAGGALAIVNKLGLTAKNAIAGVATIVAIAAGIVASSYVFQGFMPVKNLGNIVLFSIGLGIAVLFAGGALAIVNKLGLTAKNAIAGVATIVAIAAGIVASSYAFKEYVPTPLSNILNMALFTLGLGISVVIIGGTLWVLNKLGIGLGNVIVGGLSILAIASTIMLSSHIIASGNYSIYPALDWAIGVGASIIVFGAVMGTLGTILSGSIGLGAVALAAGGLAILGVAATIVATASILNTGTYTNFPNLGWAMGVGLSLTAFATGMATLGSVITGSFGLGAVALAAGGLAVIAVAKTIEESSHILATGNYKSGPTLSWASGVALAIGAYSKVFSDLNKSKIFSLFGGKALTAESYTNTIRQISLAIVESANYFSGAKASFTNAPPVSWAKGVSEAIGAFSPVIKTIMDGGILDALGEAIFGSKQDKISGAIASISNAIVGAANIFNGTTFGTFPPTAWAEGVGAAISAFSPLINEIYNEGVFKSLFGGDKNTKISDALKTIAHAIVEVGNSFAGGNFTNYPKADWSVGVGESIKGFSSLVTIANDFDSKDVLTANQRITKIIVPFMNVWSKLFASVGTVDIPTNVGQQMMSAVEGYINVIDYVAKNKSKLELLDNATLMKLSDTTDVFVKLSDAVGKLATEFKNLNQLNPDVIKIAFSSISELSLIKPDSLSPVLDLIAAKGSALQTVFNGINQSANNSSQISKADNSIETVQDNNKQKTVINDNNDMLMQKLDQLINIMGAVKSNTGAMAAFTNELRTSDLKIQA